MKKHLAILLLVLPILAVSLVHGVGIDQVVVANSVSSNGFGLTFVSENHQLVSQGCYNAQIRIVLSWNNTGTLTVAINNFYLYSTGTNLLISNSTNYGQPNNTVQFLVLFPQVPVNVILSFTRFCLPIGLSNAQVWLFYFDGANTLSVRIV